MDTGTSAIIESDTTNYLRFLNPDSANAGLVWTSPSDNFAAYLRWKYSSRVLEMGTAKTNSSISFSTGNADERMRIDSSGNVGIGTTNPSDKLDVQDGYIRVGFTGGAQFKLVPHSSNDGYGFYDVVNTNYDMWFDGGKVGIGTTSPVGKFEVQTEDSNRYIRFKAPNGEERFEFYTGGTGNASRLSMYADDGTTEGARIQSAGKSWFNGGNVGIGTSSPSNKLDVNGAIRLMGNGTNNDSHILYFTNGGATIARDNNDLELHAYNAMVFGVSNTSYPTSTERMRIDSSGNVGVGTTSPSEKLHVVGSILADSGASSNHSKLLGNAAEILIGRTTTNGIKVFAGSSNQKQIQVLGDFPLDYYINGTFHTRFDSNGNVGIGTDAPSHKLTVPSGTNGRVARLGNLEITTQAATYSGSSIEVTGFNSFIKYNSTLGHKFFKEYKAGGTRWKL